jgi:peptide/nickel transport system substrate-binding protein
MQRRCCSFILALGMAVAIGSDPAIAQKTGGILRMFNFDSPPSMSILEEATASSQGPLMGVFNNLIMFDQHEKQNSLKAIIPRSSDELDLGRGRHRADLSAATGGQMA